jgi:hypothetical protein
VAIPGRLSSVGTKRLAGHFLIQQEALMNHPKERNEFGLDMDNALDVQKERAWSMMPWALGIVALLAVGALLVFGLPNTTSKTADIPPPTTTGAATPPPQR